MLVDYVLVDPSPSVTTLKQLKKKQHRVQTKEKRDTMITEDKYVTNYTITVPKSTKIDIDEAKSKKKYRIQIKRHYGPIINGYISTP